MSVHIDTDINLKDVSTSNWNSHEDIYIRHGAKLTITQTPRKLIRSLRIEDGIVHIDGTNISADNIINVIGEGGLVDGSNDMVIQVYGQGTLKVTGDWFNIGTTNGVSGQSIDLTSATGCGLWEHGGSGDFCVDVLPMIQVETGRKLSYINGSGIPPKVGDWVYKSTDKSVSGKIHSVGSGFINVWMLTGDLLDGDSIVIRSVVDNTGPEYQRSWTATMNGADTLATGVYMEFGNARSNAVDYSTNFGNGYGGVVFHHQFGTTSLTLGNGFLPKAGCNIRVPNVILNTSSQTEYDNGNAYGADINDNEDEWWGIECSGGGTINLDTLNCGNFDLHDTQAFSYIASYVGCTAGIGSNICASRVKLTHCLETQGTEQRVVPNVSSVFGAVQDLVNGADISFCTAVMPITTRQCFGAVTSLDVNVSDCIYTGAGQGSALFTSNCFGYYFGKTTKGTIDNCLFFGNENASQSYPIYLGSANDIDINNFKFSATQDYTDVADETDAIKLSLCRNINVVGFDVIGNGIMGNNMFYILDSTNIKIRAIGMIDEKIDFGPVGEMFAYISGLCNDIDIARCWKDNGIYEEFIITATTMKNIVVSNCSGKYLSGFKPYGGDNIRLKGLHGGSGDVGNGAQGIEDHYPASYGNSWHDNFSSDTKGNLVLLMITPSELYDETTVVSGTPKFFKDGDLDMADGDSIIFEMGYEALGHISFTGNFTTARGTANLYADEWSNIDIDFQYKLNSESWNGTWLDLKTASNLTSISNFADGINLKVRLTNNSGNTVVDMSLLMIETTTSISAQKNNLYPIDQFEATLTLSGLEIGSDIVILQAGTNTVLTDVDQVSISTFDYTYSTVQSVDIGIIKPGFVTQYIYGYQLSSTNANLPITQQVDRNYQ